MVGQPFSFDDYWILVTVWMCPSRSVIDCVRLIHHIHMVRFVSAVQPGTNILIYAYSPDDPEMVDGRATIRYHGTERRYTRIIPLQSYGNPPAESKFAGLDYFDFKLNNVRASQATSVDE